LLPALPDGSDVPVDEDIRTVIYDVLGPAWAVTDESSLFDYEPGEGPATFRDPTIPEPGAPFDFDALTFDQQVSGMRSCSTVEDLTLRQQCAFDVTVTGDLGFVGSYEQTEAALGPQAGEPQPTDAGPATPLPGADACGVLTSAEVTALTGFEVLTTQPGASNGAPFTGGCHWSLDAREPDTTWDVILNVQSPGGKQAFDVYVQVFPNLEHVPGIADDAVADVANSVVAVKGDTRLDVQYINLHDPNAEAVLIEIAKEIAARF
jgi:hypothetical protein